MAKLLLGALVNAVLTLWVQLLLDLHVTHVSGHGEPRQLTYILQESERTCFSNEWTDGEKIFFEYTVVRGGNKDVDVQIITPNGMVLYERKRSDGDEVTFTPQNGEFKFCFSNEFSRISEKVVMFSIRPAYTKTLSLEAGNKEPTVKDAGQASCDAIHEAFTAVMNMQRKYRVHEMIGRHLASKLNTMVSLWSLGQTAVVLVCGIAQVVALKKFFTEKRKSTKPAEGEPEERHAVLNA